MLKINNKYIYRLVYSIAIVLSLGIIATGLSIAIGRYKESSIDNNALNKFKTVLNNSNRVSILLDGDFREPLTRNELRYVAIDSEFRERLLKCLVLEKGTFSRKTKSKYKPGTIYFIMGDFYDNDNLLMEYHISTQGEYDKRRGGAIEFGLDNYFVGSFSNTCFERELINGWKAGSPVP